jgi:hypothetical protein
MFLIGVVVGVVVTIGVGAIVIGYLTHEVERRT